MKRNVLRRIVAAVLAAGLLCPLLSGCRKPFPTEASTTIFAMDTVMNLTVMDKDPDCPLQGLVDSRVGQIQSFEALFSATKEDSNIRALNTANGEPVRIRPDTLDILTKALELCEITGGALDITAYPAVKAWGFTTGEYRVPDEAELEELTERIDYTVLELTENRFATLPAGMEVDLGAVAKGYVGDQLAEGLDERSALLDLGQSSIVAMGSKPNGVPWRIGIQNPEGEGYLGVLELVDMAMGTSGSYQRYFEQDGVRYCHIIDPRTAAPVQNELASVTVVAPSCLLCDGLSTALFVMGLEESVYFWQIHQDLEFDAIFILDDGSIYITAGLEETFSLAEGYTDREVTVIR